MLRNCAGTAIDIPPQSWIDPRLAVRSSSIHGRGIFTTAPICAGEVVMIWGGTVFTPEEICAGEALEHSYAAIDEGVILGHTCEHGNSTDDYINHSCDPNVWFTDAITLVARRDIAAGEEITADFVTYWEPDNPDEPWECHCGSPLCRGKFTTGDWRRPELQERYGEHFQPYINARIRRLRAECGD